MINRSRSIVLLAALTPVLTNAQVSILLQPTDDVGVGFHDNYPSADNNYENATHFSAFSQPGNAGGVNAGRSMVRFDLSAVPEGYEVWGAFMNLTARGPYAGTGEVASVGHMGDNACTLRRITSPWNASTVTWNTQPTSTGLHAAELPPSQYVLQNYVTIDVTAMVLDMMADPANSHGFMLQLNDESPSRGLLFHSTESALPGQAPSLLIIYGKCDELHMGLAEESYPTPALTVIPNVVQAGTNVRITLNGPSAAQARLAITDAAGRIVWTGDTKQWPMEVLMPALAAGTYVATVTDRNGNALAKARFVVN